MSSQCDSAIELYLLQNTECANNYNDLTRAILLIFLRVRSNVIARYDAHSSILF